MDPQGTRPLGLPALLDWAQSGAAAPRVLTLPGGATLWLRAEGGRARGAALPMAVSNSVTSVCLAARGITPSWFFRDRFIEGDQGPAAVSFDQRVH